MTGISIENFFNTKRNTSEIKSEVFVKYFKFWCGVLLFAQKFKKIEKLLYIDLFSGPGLYNEKNEPSTPIKILDSIISSNGKDIDLNKSVHTFFNDQNKALIDQLDSNIKNLSYFSELLNKPVLLNKSVNSELLQTLLEKGTPSLTFIDPFGYTYSMEMLLHSVKDWGSDLFMLFNVNRIRAAIKNPKVEVLMNEIFQNRLKEIKEFYINEKSPRRREEFILHIFEELFTKKGYFVFKFKINFVNKNQTSHYLYLVSKVKLAYFKIKDIMKDYSDYQPDGVPIFAANSKKAPMFFPDIERYSILNLEIDLLEKIQRFKNTTIKEIYEEHSINTNYIKSNYKQAIDNLWKKNKIVLIDIKGKDAKKITYTCKIKKHE